MRFDFAREFIGKKVLITGATGFLGRRLATDFFEMGADLILIDICQSSLEMLKKELSHLHLRGASVPKVPAVHLFECDFENKALLMEVVGSIIHNVGALDVLINNAAYTGKSELDGWAVDFDEQSYTSWQGAIKVNLDSVFLMCQFFKKLLIKSQQGRVINIGSIYGFLGPDWKLYEGNELGNPAAYAASKGGLIQLTKWLATVFAPSVTVNVVSPGGVFRNQPTEFVKKYETKTLLSRMASEEDISNMVLFVASSYSSYITGQNLVIDGGFSTT